MCRKPWNRAKEKCFCITCVRATPTIVPLKSTEEWTVMPPLYGSPLRPDVNRATIQRPYVASLSCHPGSKKCPISAPRPSSARIFLWKVDRRPRPRSTVDKGNKQNSITFIYVSTVDRDEVFNFSIASFSFWLKKQSAALRKATLRGRTPKMTYPYKDRGRVGGRVPHRGRNKTPTVDGRQGE